MSYGTPQSWITRFLRHGTLANQHLVDHQWIPPLTLWGSTRRIEVMMQMTTNQPLLFRYKGAPCEHISSILYMTRLTTTSNTFRSDHHGTNTMTRNRQREHMLPKGGHHLGDEGQRQNLMIPVLDNPRRKIHRGPRQPRSLASNLRKMETMYHLR